jgi:hypothetical protein
MKAAVLLKAGALLNAVASAQGPVFRAGTRVVEVAVIAKDGKDAPTTRIPRRSVISRGTRCAAALPRRRSRF